MRTLGLLICAICLAGTAAAATGEGRLVAQDGATLVDVPLAHTDVHIAIDGFVATTTVTQHFANAAKTKPSSAGGSKIEAVYLFPLPTSAAVSDLAIKIGDRTIRGSIAERAQAKAVYEAARKRGLVAALLTQERPNLFTQSVANLEPGAAIDVVLTYVQRLDYEDGGYSLAYPMVAGPRGPSTALSPPTLPAGLRPATDISLRVDVDAGVAIENLASTSHQIQIERHGPARATVRIAPTDNIPNKDFTLRYQVAGEATKLAVLAHRDGGEGSFVMIAQPPAAPQPDRIAPREIVFVLDTSSSMRGAPLAKAKELIRRVLWTLRPDDTFQIVRFADRASALGPGPIAAKPNNVDLTLKWLGRLEAGGTTDVITGIDAALAVPHDPLRLRVIAFLTDGYVGNEDAILASAGKHVGASRLFAFGVGSAVNRYLLEELATIGRGSVQFVRPDEDTGKAVTAFERRIDMPVLTDVRVDWGKLAVRDVPAALPDLFAGQPLVIAGHYGAAGTGTVTVHGKQAGRDVSFDVPVALPERAVRPAIAQVWARGKIAELTRKLIRKADPAAEKAILELSLAHRILTQYTAFVAVDDARKTAGGDARRVVVPVDIPDAVRGIVANASDSDYGGQGYGTAYGVMGDYTPKPYVVTPPMVVIAAPAKVVGSLDGAIIRRYVKQKSAQLRYCYEKELLRKPALAGTVTTSFVISPTGAVVSATAGGSLGDPEVNACVAQVIKTIEFPKVDGGGVIQVNYPFTFQPAETGNAHDVIKEMLK